MQRTTLRGCGVDPAAPPLGTPSGENPSSPPPQSPIPPRAQPHAAESWDPPQPLRPSAAAGWVAETSASDTGDSDCDGDDEDEEIGRPQYAWG